MNATRVYTPESQLRRPAALLEGMLRDLSASRELAWQLFRRNISVRFRQTFLGWLWAVLPLCVAAAVFVFLRRSGVLGSGEVQVPYGLYLLCGLILWHVFVDALNAPLRMVTQSRVMLIRMNFPREALVLAGAGEVIFNFLVRLLLLVPLYFHYGFVPPPTVPLALFGVAALMVLGLALGVLLVPFAVLYRDFEQAVLVFTPLWMLATPVLYAPPRSWPGTLAMTLNPVAPVLDTARAWLLTGVPAHLHAALAVTSGALLLLALAWVLYRVALPILIERMGN